MLYDIDLNNYLYTILFVLGSFSVAFAITYFTIPSVVCVAKEKKLNATPNWRTSHKSEIPNLGGINVFAGVIISTILFCMIGFHSELNYIIGGAIILFFVGIKDDILILDPSKKLIAQILAVLIVSILGDVRITSFYGLFGINEIPEFLSVCVTILFIITVTNGFNLIDGIDGLAAGIGIFTSFAFGTWFVMSNHSSYAMMSFALIGSLTAFFYFNVFGKKNKIFLGDTGSLIVGFSIAVFAIRFMEYELFSTGKLMLESTPAITFSILIIPIFDTMRVFIIRLKQKKSPFSADRQHLHHRLLDLGFGHLQSTMILILLNIVFFGATLILHNYANMIVISVQLIFATFLSFLLDGLVKQKGKKKTISFENYNSKRIESIKKHPIKLSSTLSDTE